MNALIPLEQQVLEEHVNRADFRLARKQRRWDVISVDWPNVLIRIFVATRTGGPGYFDLRFDCVGYASSPPTAILWDSVAGNPLSFARWPAGKHLIPSIFNPGWQNGTALYLPCDRMAIQGHGDWPSRYPNWIWKPQVGIIQYLRIVHALLTSEDYTGIRGA